MNTEQERAELLPCLFCGSRNVAQRFTREASFEALSFVECYDCGARGSGVSGHGGEAIEEWNRRAVLQSQDREDSGKLQEAARDIFVRASEIEILYGTNKETEGLVNAAIRLAYLVGPSEQSIDHARRIEGDEE